MIQPHIYRISTSSEKGNKKKNVSRARLLAGYGIEGDAHSDTDKPVSLLPFESFKKLEHPDITINPGDFAENITTAGLDFRELKEGARLSIGRSAVLEIIQIGKECHEGCAIKDVVGECIMPIEGVFARVITGGDIVEGDLIKINIEKLAGPICD